MNAQQKAAIAYAKERIGEGNDYTSDIVHAIKDGWIAGHGSRDAELRESFIACENMTKLYEKSQTEIGKLVEALNGTVRYLIELAAAFDHDRAFKAAIFKRIDKINEALKPYQKEEGK